MVFSLLDQRLQWLLLRLLFSEQGLQAENVDRSLDWMVSRNSKWISASVIGSRWSQSIFSMFLQVYKVWRPSSLPSSWRYGLFRCKIYPKGWIFHQLLYGKAKVAVFPVYHVNKSNLNSFLSLSNSHKRVVVLSIMVEQILAGLLVVRSSQPAMIMMLLSTNTVSLLTHHFLFPISEDCCILYKGCISFIYRTWKAA